VRELFACLLVYGTQTYGEDARIMTTILIIVLLILLLGGGGGYYGHRRYGGRGLGGVLGLMLVILLVLWLIGALGTVQI
jgi:uncharacterized protein DUF3309